MTTTMEYVSAKIIYINLINSRLVYLVVGLNWQESSDTLASGMIYAPLPNP